MKLQFNRNSELFLPEFGVYKPNQIIEVNSVSVAKKMFKTGYFNEIKEEKPIKINIKKSKKKKEVF